MIALTGPLFSIVIPTYQRRASLERCLESLAALEYSRAGFEVVVVDDGSPEPPRDVIARFGSRLDVRLVEQPHAGPATARDHGAQQARGEFLVFTDDDCAPTASFLQVLEREFLAGGTVALGGRTVNALDNVYAQTTQSLIDYLYEYFNRNASNARFFASNNLAMPRRTFFEIGGFDTSFPFAAAEDRDLCERWHAAGHALRYVDDMVVHHRHQMTLGGFWRQHCTYGRGAAHLLDARKRQARQGSKFQPAAFYVELLLHPMRQRFGWRTPAVAALTLLSQVAYATGFALELVLARGQVAARSRRQPDAPPVPPTRPTSGSATSPTRRVHRASRV